MAKAIKQAKTPVSQYGFTQLTYWRRILLMVCIFVLMMSFAGFGAQGCGMVF